HTRTGDGGGAPGPALLRMRQSGLSTMRAVRARPMPAKPSLLLSLLCAASLSACAQAPTPDSGAAASGASPEPVEQIQTVPGTPEDRAREAIESINPDIQIDAIA